MKIYARAIALIVLASHCGSAEAALTLADGGHHVIDYYPNRRVLCCWDWADWVC